MNFENQIPEWKNEGTAPSENLRTTGFQGGYKPPASVFNFFWSKVTKAITEIQTKLSGVDETALSNVGSHINNTSNPHNVTAAQVGAAAASHTHDDRYYTETEIDTKLNGKANSSHTHSEYLNKSGGTMTGSLVLNSATPTADLEAAPKKYVDDNKGVRTINATSTDGVTYTATVDGITELETGMTIILIPNRISNSTVPTLNINSLGAKTIRLYAPNTGTGAVPTVANWITAKKPLMLVYEGDAWSAVTYDFDRNVPVSKGGTGATTADAARTNLGAATKPQIKTINLDVGNWDTTTDEPFNIATVTGVTNTVDDETGQIITVAPAISSQDDYYAFGVCAKNTATNAITFVAKEPPTVNLKVYVAIQEV